MSKYKITKKTKRKEKKFSFLPLIVVVLIAAAMFFLGYFTAKKTAHNHERDEVTVEMLEDHVHEEVTMPNDTLEGSSEEESLFEPIQMGDNVWYTLYTDGTLLVTGTGSTWDFELPGDMISYLMEQLPPEYNHIENDWFRVVKEIIIDAGITRLEKNALANYSSVENVTCLASLEFIGENAFRKCGARQRAGSETTWNVDFTNVKIEDGAFNGCPNPPVECKATKLPGTNNAPVDTEESAEQP